MYLKPLTIGNLTLENNIMLAPMAGITDRPFRILCKEQNVGLTFTEMISAKALFYGDEKTKQMLNIENEQRPIGVQFFGSDIEAMKFAAEYVSKFANIIDINMGCPAPKIVKNGDGSKLLLDPKKVEKIVTAVVQNTNSPVTVKIRKGWDEEKITAVEIAKCIEEAGAAAITVHGRTRTQFYSGKADLEIIRKVKKEVSIPVIGNGDIIDEESAKRMFEQTKVDGIMIGRGAMGNPWIFRELVFYLKTGEKLAKPTLQEKLEMILLHIHKEVEEKSERVAICEMRKQICWYVKNLKESSRLREKINQITTEKEMVQVITEYFHSIGI